MESAGSAAGKSGLPPGTLVHIGEVLHPDTRVSIISFDSTQFESKTISDIKALNDYTDRGDRVNWICVEGLSNIDLIGAIGKQFDIHPLVLEDILNTHQRPKVEEFDNYLYMVAKVASPGDGEFSIAYEQISILLFDRFILTFKERQDNFFDPLKERLQHNKGSVRHQGADYLVYIILDTIVDRYFSLQDRIDDAIDELEEAMMAGPEQELLIKIQRVKRELIIIRRVVSPQRDMLGMILHRNVPLIKEQTLVYFRDVYDHIIRVSEAVESYREIMTGLLDIYVSSVSNKMNEIMKVLTAFASIFIPLTFLTGIYGMNFVDMPELKSKWGYPIMWALFIAIPLALVAVFKKKKWL